MDKLIRIATTCKIWRDTQGQDLMEYALLAGFLATLFVTIAPDIATDVVGIFGKVIATLGLAGGGDFSAEHS